MIDVAIARAETYAEPGALPEVEPADLGRDLARRDFTVNAIALDLADGALAEFPGARDDLRAGRLRVLHDRSFLDDPTRLWRLARYAARLGFEIEPRTRELAEAAVSGGALGTVSGTRIGNELRLALAEGAARASVRGRPRPRALARPGPRSDRARAGDPPGRRRPFAGGSCHRRPRAAARARPHGDRDPCRPRGARPA